MWTATLFTLHANLGKSSQIELAHERLVLVRRRLLEGGVPPASIQVAGVATLEGGAIVQRRVEMYLNE